MLSLGFGGIPEGEYDEASLQDTISERMRVLLEAHGWFSSFGRDPVLILIEYEELCDHNEENDE